MPTVDFSENKLLKQLLVDRDQSFWQRLADRTVNADAFEDLCFLSTLRRKAIAAGFNSMPVAPRVTRIAIVGGFTLYPLTDLIQHLLFVKGQQIEIWAGEYDNYAWEIMDSASNLYSFEPDFIVFIPPASRFKYQGKLSDPRDQAEEEISKQKQVILDLCERMHKTSGAEIILCNFPLPCYHDPGTLRTRTLASEWSSLKLLNLQLGLEAQNYTHVCDLEFLSARMGGVNTRDDRAWFESKQPFSADFACCAAREIAHIVLSVRASNKKVLVMDLDQTIWGGVIGDDGLNGIELGDTSPRGQCFKEFQRSLLELSERGVLLGVCSKNDLENALEPFAKHPEMVLKRNNIASFKANWNPKSQNLIEMADELNLSLDSFVFVDDNPAEIEIVRQFAPAVSVLWLGEDPAKYIQTLKDSRLFEPLQLTKEDEGRAELYQQEQLRQENLHASVDMDSYLESLQMVAIIDDFRQVDIPRITQLINKSNQFNLTTKRRTEAEVADLIDSDNICFSVRLKDRFGDLGLVSVVIATPVDSSRLLIDTWIMSCRVLKRQLEYAAMNELQQRAKNKFVSISGVYIPTAKNQMVKDFYQCMGFTLLRTSSEVTESESNPSAFEPFVTQITVVRDLDGQSEPVV